MDSRLTFSRVVSCVRGMPLTNSASMLNLGLFCVLDVQWNLSNLDTSGAEESVIVSEVSSFEMHARVVLGVGKGVLSAGVSS